MSNPYPVGTVVFAKLKGYPWWPARIENEEDLPINVSSKKPKQRPIWPVFFFGSYDYGWFGTSELKTFDPASADKAKSTLKKGNGLHTALAEALDPSLIVNIPEDYEDENKSEEIAPKKKTSKAKPKRTEKTELGSPVEKKRRSSASEDPKRKASKRVPDDDDDDEEETPKSKKRLMSRGRSDTKKSEDIVHDTSNGTKRSDDDADSGDHARVKKKIRSGQPNERLLKLRHKLQKLLLVEGLSDEILVQNLERADPILAEVEAFKIDLQMLKDTKIGRLMKKISCLQFSHDQHHIVDRSLKLIKLYKSMMEAHANGEHSSHGVTSEPPSHTAISTTLASTGQKGGNVQDVHTDVSLSLNKSPESLLASKEVTPSGPAPEAVVAAVAAIVGGDTFPPIEPPKNPKDSNVPV
ncbi:hypothetical protein BG006_001178 [Podila minutissima]|uniref:PWWP domain-containing protein n=1 Tax=Podila minutissima TaxID=64525 RepID=A0A9P5SRG4_9FUNG|nr:hypothetical protein BG006_001178 [Podila minutissima]